MNRKENWKVDILGIPQTVPLIIKFSLIIKLIIIYNKNESKI